MRVGMYFPFVCGTNRQIINWSQGILLRQVSTLIYELGLDFKFFNNDDLNKIL